MTTSTMFIVSTQVAYAQLTTSLT